MYQLTLDRKAQVAVSAGAAEETISRDVSVIS